SILHVGYDDTIQQPDQDNRFAIDVGDFERRLGRLGNHVVFPVRASVFDNRVDQLAAGNGPNIQFIRHSAFNQFPLLLDVSVNAALQVTDQSVSKSLVGSGDDGIGQVNACPSQYDCQENDRT